MPLQAPQADLARLDQAFQDLRGQVSLEALFFRHLPHPLHTCTTLQALEPLTGPGVTLLQEGEQSTLWELLSGQEDHVGKRSRVLGIRLELLLVPLFQLVRVPDEDQLGIVKEGRASAKVGEFGPAHFGGDHRMEEQFLAIRGSDDPFLESSHGLTNEISLFSEEDVDRRELCFGQEGFELPPRGGSIPCGSSCHLLGLPFLGWKISSADQNPRRIRSTTLSDILPARSIRASSRLSLNNNGSELA